MRLLSTLFQREFGIYLSFRDLFPIAQKKVISARITTIILAIRDIQYLFDELSNCIILNSKHFVKQTKTYTLSSYELFLPQNIAVFSYA